MFKYILYGLARAQGVYLVMVDSRNRHGGQLAVALTHPMEQQIQNVAVLYPYHFENLENNSILKDAQTAKIEHRRFKNDFWKYPELITRATNRLKKFETKK